MKPIYRAYGSKNELPRPGSSNGAPWKFTSRPGGWVLAERLRADGTYERVRFLASESRGKLSVSLGGHLWFGDVQDQRAAGGAGTSDADLIAQFPGKVRKVLVRAGAIVKEGDPLVLVEAMKMEFAVKAPFAGTIQAVLVKEGQQLSPGDRFVDLAVEAEVGAKK